MKMDYSDPFHHGRPIAVRHRLRAVLRRLSVAIFGVEFSLVPQSLERKLRAESVGFFMYFHPVYSREFFSFSVK